MSYFNTLTRSGSDTVLSGGNSIEWTRD